MLKEDFVLKKLRDIEDTQETLNKKTESIEQNIANIEASIKKIAEIPIQEREKVESLSKRVSDLKSSLTSSLNDDLIKLTHRFSKDMAKTLCFNNSMVYEEVHKEQQRSIDFTNQAMVQRLSILCGQLNRKDLQEVFDKELEWLKSKKYEKAVKKVLDNKEARHSSQA